jgi:hypothetical protein
MMQPTQDRWRPDDATLGVLLGCRRNWDSLTDPLMRAAGVEITKRVRAEDMLEMAPPENDHVVETLKLSQAHTG